MAPTGERPRFHVSRHRGLEKKLLKAMFLVFALLLLLGFGLAEWMDWRLRCQLRTMADLRRIGAALDSYQLEHGAYPADVDGTVAGISSGLQRESVEELPTTDAWGNPYRYSVGPRLWYRNEEPVEEEIYTLESYGRDGRNSGPGSGAVEDSAHDLVFSVGSFVTYPAQNLGS